MLCYTIRHTVDAYWEMVSMKDEEDEEPPFSSLQALVDSFDGIDISEGDLVETPDSSPNVDERLSHIPVIM